jgi:hypothetical protein
LSNYRGIKTVRDDAFAGAEKVEPVLSLVRLQVQEVRPAAELL